MVNPITRSPRRCSMPATTELSTPPDIATAMPPGCVPNSSTGSDMRGLGLSGGDRSGSDLPQVRDGLSDRDDQRVHLLRVIPPAQRKTETGPRLLLRQSNRREDMRRLSRSAGARRAAGHRESLQVERDQQRFAVDPVKADVRRVGNPRRARSVNVRVLHAAENALL